MEIPKLKTWQRHGDLVLLSERDLKRPLTEDEVNAICKRYKCNRLAVRGCIQADGRRTPVITLLNTEDPWVVHVDNKIIYTFDVSKCMFSFGNINEKIRLSRIDCSNEVVVDLFAGIGYFTLPFLVHSRAKYVHACDWNPHAIEALKRGLILNKVSDRCTIHFGDNREVCPIGVADRVILGLIPSSRMSWKTAILALKEDSGGILHVHENVNSFGAKGSEEKEKIWNTWSLHVQQDLMSIFQDTFPQSLWSVDIESINKVKQYAPHIHHLVLDVRCRPLSP